MQIPASTQQYISQVSSKYNKDFQICSKGNPNWLLKIITPIVSLFNPQFTTDYITVLYGTMWVPVDFDQRTNESGWLRTTIHETMHEKDRMRFKSVLFTFLYLFPQSLAPLALLALGACGGNLLWLWWLLALLYLAPMPAPFRTWFEIRAYRTNLLFAQTVWKYDAEQLSRLQEWIVDKLAGPDYYYSWTCKRQLRKILSDMSFMETEEYVEIKEWILNNYRA